jgi:hypothetical protein
MNIKLEYMYRDGGNNKRRQYVIFANPASRSVEDVVERMDAAAAKWRLFSGTIHFCPEAVGLPTCYFTDAGYPATCDDLELHEIEGVEGCAGVVSDRRTIDEFLADVETA